jgi:hypothetical protein
MQTTLRMGKKGHNRGVNIKYNAFEFGDVCREFIQAGGDIETAARLFKRKINTIQLWINLSEQFPPEYRFPEIAPSYYLNLSRAPDPFKAVQFVRQEYLRGYPMSEVEIDGLITQWLKHKSRRPFVLANYTRIKYHQNIDKFTDEQTAEAMGLPVEFITRLRFQREGRIPDFLNTESIDYVIVLQKRIENLEKQLPPSIEPDDTIVELRMYKTGGRPEKPVDSGRLISLHAQGLTDEEIAKKLNISRSTIIRRREDLGLPPNRTRGQRGPGKSTKPTKQNRKKVS